MRIIIEDGDIVKTGNGWGVEIYPNTNGSNGRTLRVALSRKVGKTVPEFAEVAPLKSKDKKKSHKKRLLMMFPDKGKESDTIFLVGGFVRTEINSDINIDSRLTTATILDKENGNSVSGADVVFIATLSPGQRIVSTCHDRSRHIFWNRRGELCSVVLPIEEWAEYKRILSEKKEQ